MLPLALIFSSLLQEAHLFRPRVFRNFSSAVGPGLATLLVVLGGFLNAQQHLRAKLGREKLDVLIPKQSKHLHSVKESLGLLKTPEKKYKPNHPKFVKLYPMGKYNAFNKTQESPELMFSQSGTGFIPDTRLDIPLIWQCIHSQHSMAGR